MVREEGAREETSSERKENTGGPQMRLFRTEEPMESLGKWKKEDTKLQGLQ